jgi:DUF1680 family protein
MCDLQRAGSRETQNLTIRQQTEFPENDSLRLTFRLKTPTKPAVNVRWPAWADKISIRVNGRKQKVSGTPESYVSINRQWRDGDWLDIEWPMRLHLEPLPGTDRFRLRRQIR